MERWSALRQFPDGGSGGLGAAGRGRSFLNGITFSYRSTTAASGRFMAEGGAPAPNTGRRYCGATARLLAGSSLYYTIMINGSSHFRVNGTG
jgi:hypothetical protein